MGLQASADSGLYNLLKSYYTTDKTVSLMWANSKYNREMPKERFYGKEYRDSLPWNNNASASGDATVAKTIGVAYASSGIAERIMPPGKIFSYNIMAQLEYLAGQDDGAYESIMSLSLWQATDALRKKTAAALYAAGYGEVGFIQDGTLATSGSFIASPETAYNMLVGMQFNVTAGTTTLPNEAFQSGGPFTVTAITPAISGPGGATIAFTPNAGAAFVAGAIVESLGGRDSSLAPNEPVGLGGQIPVFGHRTGANWTTYIGTSLFGINRSVAVRQLAGTYFLNPGQSSLTETIIEGSRLCRAAGGNPGAILINDYKYEEWLNESPTVASQIPYKLPDWAIIPDPHCPYGRAYFLDADAIKFVSFTNSAHILADEDKTPDGTPDSESDKLETMTYEEWKKKDEADRKAQTDSPAKIKPETGDFEMGVDDFLTLAPTSSVTTEGPAMEMYISLVGQYVVRNPAHCAVVEF